jgi:hypothetical protein
MIIMLSAPDMLVEEDITLHMNFQFISGRDAIIGRDIVTPLFV